MIIQAICPPLCGNPSQPLIPLVPTLQSITPSTLPVGSALTAMTVKGTNFTADSVVTVDGTDRVTNYVDSETLTGHLLPSADPTPRTVQVGVRTGALVATPTLPFIYTATTLHIASIDPTVLLINGPSTMVTATGTGFINNTQILANGSPAYQVQYVNPTTVRFAVKPPSVEGEQTITVRNGSVNGTGAPILRFDDPSTIEQPVLTLLNPNHAIAGAADTTVTVTGTNIAPATVILWDGAARATTYVNATTLTFVAPTSTELTPRTAQVSARTDTVTWSGSLPFTIDSPV